MTMEIIRPRVLKIVDRLSAFGQQIEDICYEGCRIDEPPLSEHEKELLAEAAESVISGGLSLAWKFDLSELTGIPLCASVRIDGRLTPDFLIRRLLNASTYPGEFGKALRMHADTVDKEETMSQ